MPDLGRSGKVGDEKRSDSLGEFPRVVRAIGREMERGASSEEMNLDLIEEHQAESLEFAQHNYLYISARGHIGPCYHTNSQSTVNRVQ